MPEQQPRNASSMAKRVAMTLSCRDTDLLPKVPGAGEVFVRDGVTLQRMHNGLLIAEGCYYGPWMTEIIEGLGGHHEPQEELVFAAVLNRMAETTSPGRRLVAVELGSFWAYYSMWFLSRFSEGRAICVEPDSAYLAIGQRNFELNGLQGEFIHAAIGGEPGLLTNFTQESDGACHLLPQHDLGSLLKERAIGELDLLMVDIQGFETVLLERASELLAAGRVRYLVVSTHHHSISGDALTHQRVRDVLVRTGGRILAEHSVGESFSGDGLVAASFDPADTGLAQISHSFARAQESLFGELEYDLARALSDRAEAQSELALLHRAFEQAVTAHDQAVAHAQELGRTVERLTVEFDNADRAHANALRARDEALGALAAAVVASEA